MTVPYADNLEHLRDEMAKLDLAIRRSVNRVKASEATGTYISDASVDKRLQPGNPQPDPDDDVVLRAVEDKRAEVVDRIAASLAQGVALRLPQLARTFRLSPFETDVLLVLLAPELDLKYERLYAYLQDDVSRRHPTVDLVCRLLCQMPEDWPLAREAFLTSSRLSRYALTRHLEPAGACSLLARSLRIDGRIADFLLGSDALDPRIAHGVRRIPAQPLPQDTPEPDLAVALRRYVAEPSPQQWIALFHGADAQGQQEAVRTLCAGLNLPLLEADLEAFLEDTAGFDEHLRLILREGALATGAVCLRHEGGLGGDGEKPSVIRRSMESALREFGWIAFICGPTAWNPPDGLKQQWLFRQEFPVPGATERAELWRAALEEAQVAEDVAIDELASGFRFGQREIGNAVAQAINQSMLRTNGDFNLSQADLQSASRAESSRRLLGFARQIDSPQSWPDLVLPQEQQDHLHEVLDYIRHHEAIFGVWGFGTKLGLGKGINILFSGPSGTGKTMAASILARELGVNLYKIDLSTVVSKYIGETEKNLSRVFRETENSNGILFFDEADALFGKRSEVKDAHDRYANIEVNYLLQKMEEHEGIAILATNLSKNIDEAFLRRLQFTVAFPFPERDERLRIWRGIFPPQAPLDPDLDMDFLARRLKISGGNIKNIALSAAFLARADGTAIAMKHVILATKREFQKLGKLRLKSDFGDYYELVS